MKHSVVEWLTLLRRDLARWPFDFTVNVLAASVLVPRVVRHRLLRIAGVRTSTRYVHPGCFFLSSCVTLGARTLINRRCRFDSEADIVIGDDVHVAMDVSFVTSTHAPGVPERRAADVVSAAIHVEDGCWIGAGVTVLPGVTIQRGCVVAAGSVVVRGCEPNGLYAGVPARRIRDLATTGPNRV